MMNDSCMVYAYKRKGLVCMHDMLMHTLIMMNAYGCKELWFVCVVYMYVMYAWLYEELLVFPT